MEKKKRPWLFRHPWSLVALPWIVISLFIIVIALVIPSSEEPEINYTLLLFTGKKTYGINEYVEISGYLIHGEDPVEDWDISLSTWIGNFPHLSQLKTNEDGYFSTEVYIPGMTSEGSHKVLAVASGLGVLNESYFTVSLDGSGDVMIAHQNKLIPNLPGS